MPHRSTSQLLRFHFSFFLLPVYLFAISQMPNVDWRKALLVFIILHLLVYPASNGYNSYMDRDETPIGGLAKPLPPTKQLFYITLCMDIGSVLLSLIISPLFSLGILFYILASRSYSYRGVRLKQYPFIGFLVVFVFQGAWIFYLTYYACLWYSKGSVPWLPCMIASLLIGALYPLTQIYQHEADKKDGVITLSYKLGKRGTFIFSALLFAAATVCLYILFSRQEQYNLFYLFLLCTGPVVLFFIYWMFKVWQNSALADFKHSLLMNVIATACMTLFFTILILKTYFE